MKEWITGTGKEQINATVADWPMRADIFSLEHLQEPFIRETTVSRAYITQFPLQLDANHMTRACQW